ncbi:MAG: hypothetical protein ACM31O_16315 [Bacteroidota bacterium]
MTRGPYVFVAFVWVILGASFLASTGLVIHEFWDLDWLGIVLAHSHLFLFFPVFGLLVLAAFYLPSVVLTHMYWYHVRPLGRLRFVLGFFVVVAASLFVSNLLTSGSLRGIWEISPDALQKDRGTPPGCGQGAGAPPCQRAAILPVLAKLRMEGPHRMGLSEFARNCKPDPLLPLPQTFTEQRYCFPALDMQSGEACCKAQANFARAVATLSNDPATRSLAADRDRILLPFKVFFITVMIVTALLLAFWRPRLDHLYGKRVRALERGIIIGAAALLFWPVMDYGYQQTADILFGRNYGAFTPRWSLVIGPWAVFLLFFFLRRLGKNLAMVGQIGGLVGGLFAALRYQDINNWAQRFLGSGAEQWVFFALMALAVIGLIGLLWPIKQVEDEATAAENEAARARVDIVPGRPRRPRLASGPLT